MTMSSTGDFEIPFDEAFLDVQGRQTRITVDDFFALPISVRVRHVIERTVTFRLRGAVVDQKEALSAMRRFRTGSRPIAR
jgi:hypothetical protein